MIDVLFRQTKARFRRLTGNEHHRYVAIAVITAFGLAVRLYLAFTNFCISGDGVGYIRMARLFAAGKWWDALSGVPSPLYPWLIALTHRVISNWELAGELVSVAFGTAAVVAAWALMNEVYECEQLSLCAALLVAIHPRLAAYSASVLTEAGFIFLVVLSLYLFIRSLRRQSLWETALAGVVSGISYLYRTEGIGFAIILTLFPLVAQRLSKKWSVGFGVRAAVTYGVAFGFVASPYLIYLRFATGHWLVGRELTAAVYYHMGEVSSSGERWRALAFENYAPILKPILEAPGLYAKKVATDLVMSFYDLVKALEPLFAAALVMGLWSGETALGTNWKENLLGCVVLFYFVGLAFLYTGERFLAHYMTLTFGRVAMGISLAVRRLGGLKVFGRRLLRPEVLFAVIGLVTLPRTLWPLGYDMRGYRLAGIRIAHAIDKAGAVAASDSRVAFYAGVEHVQLPNEPAPNLCGWLREHPAVRFVVLSSREETGAKDPHKADCLSLWERYPRYGRGYYDLFIVNEPR